MSFFIIFVDDFSFLLYIVRMNILVDANIFLAVVMNEPEKGRIIKLTNNASLISPAVLPYEVGNALSAMGRQKRLTEYQIFAGFSLFEKIPVRLVPVQVDSALAIAVKYNIYAYDAYYIETAGRLQLSVLTLDQKMKEVAAQLNIAVLEV
jgi:predicted nucleic acid-binding protein